jgi:hypothetical protein
MALFRYNAKKNLSVLQSSACLRMPYFLFFILNLNKFMGGLDKFIYQDY